MGKSISEWETIFNDMGDKKLKDTVGSLKTIPIEIFEEFETLDTIIGIAKNVLKHRESEPKEQLFEVRELNNYESLTNDVYDDLGIMTQAEINKYEDDNPDSEIQKKPYNPEEETDDREEE